MDRKSSLSNKIYSFKFASCYFAIQGGKVTEEVILAVAELNQNEYYLSKYLKLLLNFQLKLYDKVLQCLDIFLSIDLKKAQERLVLHVDTDLINTKYMPELDNLIEIIKFMLLISLLETSTLKRTVRVSKSPLIHFVKKAIEILRSKTEANMDYRFSEENRALIFYYREIKVNEKKGLINQAFYGASVLNDLQKLCEIWTKQEDVNKNTGNQETIQIEFKRWSHQLKGKSLDRLAQLSQKLSFQLIQNVKVLEESNLQLKNRELQNAKALEAYHSGLYRSHLKNYSIYKKYVEFMRDVYVYLSGTSTDKTNPTFGECIDFCSSYNSYLKELQKAAKEMERRFLYKNLDQDSLLNFVLQEPPKMNGAKLDAVFYSKSITNAKSQESAPGPSGFNSRSTIRDTMNSEMELFEFLLSNTDLSEEELMLTLSKQLEKNVNFKYMSKEAVLQEVLLVSNTCCICLEIIESEAEKQTLSCSHEFHKICIKGWFVKNSTCPSCRATDPRKVNKVNRS